MAMTYTSKAVPVLPTFSHIASTPPMCCACHTTPHRTWSQVLNRNVPMPDLDPFRKAVRKASDCLMASDAECAKKNLQDALKVRVWGASGRGTAEWGERGAGGRGRGAVLPWDEERSRCVCGAVCLASFL